MPLKSDRYPPELIAAFEQGSTAPYDIPCPTRNKAFKWRQTLNAARKALFRDSEADPGNSILAAKARTIKPVFVTLVEPTEEGEPWLIRLRPAHDDLVAAIQDSGLQLNQGPSQPAAEGDPLASFLQAEDPQPLTAEEIGDLETKTLDAMSRSLKGK